MYDCTTHLPLNQGSYQLCMEVLAKRYFLNISFPRLGCMLSTLDMANQSPAPIHPALQLVFFLGHGFFPIKALKRFFV